MSELKKKITYVAITDHPQVQFVVFLVDVKNGKVPWLEKFDFLNKIFCIFVRRTFIGWSEWCLLLRLEMMTIFLIVDLFFRFTLNGRFPAFFTE